MTKLLSLSLLVVGMSFSQPVGPSAPIPISKAPEIDPGQAAGALALLSAGILIMRRKK
jgi:hypothetical protein